MTLPLKRCPDCGSRMSPCPARVDGEDTFVGYYACLCYDAGIDNAEFDAQLLQRLAGELYQHARAHYNDGGWDVIVECWANSEIEDYLRDDRCKTLEDAIKSFAPLIDVWSDRQADADYERRMALGDEA